MCGTCGCGQTLIKPARAKGAQGALNFRPAADAHGAESLVSDAAASATESRRIKVERDLLAENDAWAGNNRARFAADRTLVLNLVSSPGSGKTTLLVRTLQELRGRVPLAVIEGDQQTENDAERIRATGVPAVQINTGKGCHLDAAMVQHGTEELPPLAGGVLFIENVGNLVCPASFDLGEAAKVLVLSVTEGEDKPLKYPDMFRAARLMLLNKCDLLPHLSFDADLACANARRVNPDIEIIRLSATSGEGMDEWLRWIDRNQVPAARPAATGVPR
jgi:hydrogenase nickel incorporation protein HypB